MSSLKILPGTGRGTATRSVGVVGTHVWAQRRVGRVPTVSRWRGCHLPVSGRISC
jgi:hypothetical protein